MTRLEPLSVELPHTPLSRRAFLKTAGTGLAAAGLLGNIEAASLAQPRAVAPPNSPATKPIPLPPFDAPTERTRRAF